MWEIASIENSSDPKCDIWISDGRSINYRRGGKGSRYRVWCSNHGNIFITDIGHQSGGPHHWALDLNGQTYWYDGDGSINITFQANGAFIASGDGNHINGKLNPSPAISDAHLMLFREMIERKLVPYQKIPDEPGKTTEQIRALGKKFFGHSRFSFEMAMAVYDWTTANFFRLDLFNFFAYTQVEDQPIDSTSIASLIWTANWPPYTPHDKYFMNSLMMTPADSLQNVQEQLKTHAPQLIQYNQAETDILQQALMNLPRVLVASKPILYHGGPDISNMSKDQISAQFQQLPGNAGPVNKPLGLPFDQALTTLLSPGSTITTKGFWAFTDSMQDAMHYSNGIVVEVFPPNDAEYWPAMAYITPLSDGPEKTEYLFASGVSFECLSQKWKHEGDKKILVLAVQLQNKPLELKETSPAELIMTK
jgi:hypothetical protein